MRNQTEITTLEELERDYNKKLKWLEFSVSIASSIIASIVVSMALAVGLRLL